MIAATPTNENRPRLRTLAQHTPAVAGALALGAGLTTSGDADAALIIQNIGETASNSSVKFDLDGDGKNDFEVKAKLGKFDKNGEGKEPIDAAAIEGLNKKNGFGIGTVSKSKDNKFAVMLAAGDKVDADLFDGTDGIGSEFGFLYDDTKLFNAKSGPWGDIGATGFVGLALDIPNASVHYGWVEITRGSAIVGRAGFQTTAGAPAPIPTAAVPEPGTLALLALGAAGLMGRRRRRAIGGPRH